MSLPTGLWADRYPPVTHLEGEESEPVDVKIRWYRLVATRLRWFEAPLKVKVSLFLVVSAALSSLGLGIARAPAETLFSLLVVALVVLAGWALITLAEFYA